MPRDLTFYGWRDDLFEMESPDPKEPEEIISYRNAGVYVIEAFGQQGMQVVGLYSFHEGAAGVENGVWSVGIAPLDEDVPLPDWPIRYSSEGYTAKLTVTVPDDAKVRVSEYFASDRD